jgi:hypothetical protein
MRNDVCASSEYETTSLCPLSNIQRDKNVSEARIVSVLRWYKRSQYWFRVRDFLFLTDQNRVGVSSVFYLRKETDPVSETFSIWILDNGKSQITRLSRVLRNIGRIVKNLQLRSLYFICCPQFYTLHVLLGMIYNTLICMCLVDFCSKALS